MRELFSILKNDSNAAHRVMATILENGLESKTLIYGYEIIHCTGEEQFYRRYLDEIADVRITGVYEIGGREVYCEVMEETPKLIICGAGHVGAACIKAASNLDMHIICIEDRQDYAELAKSLGSHEVICGDYASVLDDIEGGESVYFLVATRAHAFDQVCLEHILSKKFAYVGMLGSPGKINTVKAGLAASGINEERFALVHTPVGIDISASTPEEIAIAILAEIISVKNTGGVITRTFSHEQLDAIASDAGKPLLATVIRKIMSSPRDPGTKMVVTSDGEKWGTIGGGMAEHQALLIAREHLEDPDFVTEVIRVGDAESSSDGKVCGGVIDVLFERIQ